VKVGIEVRKAGSYYFEPKSDVVDFATYTTLLDVSLTDESASRKAFLITTLPSTVGFSLADRAATSESLGSWLVLCGVRPYPI